MHSVYVLKSKKDSKLYIGYSSDIKERLRLHNEGKVLSTKGNRPWKLVYLEMYLSQSNAMRREKYLKSGWGRRFLYKNLKDTLKK